MAREITDTWDDIYDELAMDSSHHATKRRIPKSEIKNGDRFRFDDEVEFDKNDGPDRSGHKDLRTGYPTDDGFRLICKNEEQKEFAKKVAQIYGQRYEENGNVITIHVDGLDEAFSGKKKDLSKVKGSMTQVLENDDGWKNSVTARDVYDYVKATFEENNIDTVASRRLLLNISKKRDLTGALSCVYNSLMAGEGRETIK